MRTRWLIRVEGYGTGRTRIDDLHVAEQAAQVLRDGGYDANVLPAPS